MTYDSHTLVHAHTYTYREAERTQKIQRETGREKNRHTPNTHTVEGEGESGHQNKESSRAF